MTQPQTDCPAGGRCDHDEACNTRGCLRLDPPLIGAPPVREPTPVRAALEAAGRALCFGQNGIDCDTCLTADQCRKPGHWNVEAAATVAAFLRAITTDAEPGRIHAPGIGWMRVQDLAAAAEEAANVR